MTIPTENFLQDKGKIITDPNTGVPIMVDRLISAGDAAAAINRIRSEIFGAHRVAQQAQERLAHVQYVTHDQFTQLFGISE